MAIAVRGTPTSLANATRTTTTVNMPAGVQAGDVVLIWVSCGGSSSVTPTAPGTVTPVIANFPYSDNSPAWTVNTRVWRYTVVGSGDPASFAFTHSSTASEAVAIAFSGVDNTTPIDATPTTNGANNAGSTTATALGVTTTVPGVELVVYRGSWDGNAITPPSGFTERLDQPVTWVGTQNMAAAGATGNFVIPTGNGGSSPWACVLVPLRPAGGGAQTGTASSAGAGTISAAGIAGRIATAALAATATITAAGVVDHPGSANIAGTGSVAAAGVVSKAATSSLIGTGTVSASGTVAGNGTGSAAVAGTGSANASGRLAIAGGTSVAGTASTTTAGQVAKTSTAAIAGTGNIAADGATSSSSGSSVSVAGVGTLSAAGVVARSGTAAVVGTGSVVVNGVRNVTSTAAIAGTGAVSTAGARGAYSVAAVVGTAAFAVTAAGLTGSAAIQGLGAVSAYEFEIPPLPIDGVSLTVSVDTRGLSVTTETRSLEVET